MGEGEPDVSCDEEARLVTVAILVSRVEALVVSSRLRAAGIFVHAGAVDHASVYPFSLALYGHRIRVPDLQAGQACLLLAEAEPWTFCAGLRRAVGRFLAIWVFLQAAGLGAGIAAGVATPWMLLLAPLAAFEVPVNPQGSGDFMSVRSRPSPDTSG